MLKKKIFYIRFFKRKNRAAPPSENRSFKRQRITATAGFNGLFLMHALFHVFLFHIRAILLVLCLQILPFFLLIGFQ